MKSKRERLYNHTSTDTARRVIASIGVLAGIASLKGILILSGIDALRIIFEGIGIQICPQIVLTTLGVMIIIAWAYHLSHEINLPAMTISSG